MEYFSDELKPCDAGGFLAEAERWRVADGLARDGAFVEFSSVDGDGVFG
jgi:hypothetical protein